MSLPRFRVFRLSPAHTATLGSFRPEPIGNSFIDHCPLALTFWLFVSSSLLFLSLVFFCSELTYDPTSRTRWQWHSRRRRITTNTNSRWCNSPRHTIKAVHSFLCTRSRPPCHYFYASCSEHSTVLLFNSHKPPSNFQTAKLPAQHYPALAQY